MTRKIRIGLFFNTSTNFPQAAVNMTDGFRACFAQGGESFEVIGYEVGTNPRSLVSLVARSCLADRLDVIVTNVGYASLNKLVQGVALYRKPIFVISSGADSVRREELHPLVFRNSMLYWQSAYEAGRWAGRSAKGRVMLLTSMFDCCYDSHAAFLDGVKEVGGEAVVHVCDAPDYTFHGEELAGAIHTAKPGLLAVFANGNTAAQMTFVIGGDPLLSSIPMLVGPMLQEEPLLSCLGESVSGKPSFFSFAEEMLAADSDVCREFNTRWAVVSSARPDFFSVFAYETALFIRKAVESQGVDAAGLPDWKKALEGLEIESPRGRITMDGVWHTTDGRVYCRGAESNCGRTSAFPGGSSVAESDGNPQYQAIFEGHYNRWVTDYLQ